jgi:radical SAM protein with 4Fe4S-binding SPASM domain
MEITPFTPFKLLRHSDRVEKMLAGETVYPVSVEIDLANVCNHKCPWCSYNGFRQENWVQFPDSRILSLIDELADVGVKSITFTGGGEPLVHRIAAEVFTHTHSRGIQFGLVTNGRRLENGVLAALKPAVFVRVSLDAGTTQTHQLLHGTALPEFDRILKNMANLRTVAGPSLTIGASFCVFDINLQEIDEAARKVKEAGGNYLEVRPVFPTDWRGGGFTNPLTVGHVELAERSLEFTKKQYDGDGFRTIGMIHRFDQVTDRSKPYTKCQIGPLTTVINADGFIYHCCQQRGMPDFRAGSVLEKPFKDVWLNQQHRAMIDRIDVKKCPPCRYDGFNQLLQDAYQQDGMHAAFL